MKNKSPVERYVMLFVPFGLALLFQGTPVISYFIAWLGSFLIVFLSLSGFLKPLPNDLHISEQLMRPIILVQIVFSGYMAFCSIFYFFNVLGYEDFHPTTNPLFAVDKEKLELLALCQRYYV